MGCPKLHEGWRFVSAEPAKAPACPFLFSPEYLDSETGLVYYNYRYYSPELGRWINRDRIKQKNSYLYISNRIVNTWDKNGLDDVRFYDIKTGLWKDPYFSCPSKGDIFYYQDESWFLGWDYSDGSYYVGTVVDNQGNTKLSKHISKVLGDINGQFIIGRGELRKIGAYDNYEEFLEALRSLFSSGLSDLCICCEDLKEAIEQFETVPARLRENARLANNLSELTKGLERAGSNEFFWGWAGKSLSDPLYKIVNTVENNARFNNTVRNISHPNISTSAPEYAKAWAEAEAKRMESFIDLLKLEYKARNCDEK